MNWEDQRREARRPVRGIARMAQRTSILLGDDERNVHPCKVLDASDSGYRISLKPMPKLEVGSEILLEHSDKSRQRLAVCWVSDYEAGLKVAE
ncbi:MAG TPA: hypothetical protein VL356_06750 [Acidocella sp.]|nr:hypothetical protein [Acidocella sp.]